MSALFRCREASQSTVIHCRALIAMCILLNLEEIMHVPELSLVVLRVKSLPAVQETWVRSLGWEDPLEEGMVIPSSILAWRIPMDRGAWRASVHGVSKSQTQLSDCPQHGNPCPKSSRCWRRDYGRPWALHTGTAGDWRLGASREVWQWLWWPGM